MPTRRDFLAAAAAGAAAPQKGRRGSNSIELRTHEWFGDRLERFQFPAGWRISIQHMKGHQARPLTPAEIRQAIHSPVGTRPLREIAAGIRDENILFVAAYGCHYQMNGMEVAKKLGEETVRRHPWINHNIWENLVDLGTTKAGNQILVNTYYVKADVKITLSGLKAHGTPGYGGGPKLILPGICGMKTIRYMHREIKRPRRPPTRDGIPIYYMWENEPTCTWPSTPTPACSTARRRWICRKECDDADDVCAGPGPRRYRS